MSGADYKPTLRLGEEMQTSVVSFAEGHANLLDPPATPTLTEGVVPDFGFAPQQASTQFTGGVIAQ